MTMIWGIVVGADMQRSDRCEKCAAGDDACILHRAPPTAQTVLHPICFPGAFEKVGEIPRQRARLFGGLAHFAERRRLQPE